MGAAREVLEAHLVSDWARLDSETPANWRFLGPKVCTGVAAGKRYERREILEKLELRGAVWTTSETFDDGEARFAAVCELGLEGVVAKKRPTFRHGVKG